MQILSVMLKLVCYSFPHCLSQAMCKKKRSVVRGKLSVDRLHRRCSGAAVCRNPTQKVMSYTPFAFLTGGIWSMLAGLIGMKIATNSNARTAQAASESLNRGLRVAFSSGAVMGFTVVGLGMLDISIWLMILHFGAGITDPVQLGNIIVMNGIGASFMALFARVGGGIYTKAADVGADLVGKVEAGIPEDDPRNPATIADNVGDNVGDVAGMGADLYESYVGSILATFALGACAGYGWQGMLLPMALAVCGIICSIIGSFLVKTKEDATQKSLLTSLRTGTYTAAILSAIVAAPLCYFILGPENNCWGIFIAILCGLIGGTLIGYFTEYFTSDNYKPTKKLAAASETGAATIIIGGISLGLMSTIASILIVAVAILISYFAAGGTTSILDEMGGFSLSFNQGLYGIGIAGVGMLSTLGITLATDAYGPVADNAGGIAEMSGLPEEVRDRTDALDSLGNTTAATGKGFAIGSASLTALALLDVEERKVFSSGVRNTYASTGTRAHMRKPMIRTWTTVGEDNINGSKSQDYYVDPQGAPMSTLYRTVPWRT